MTNPTSSRFPKFGASKLRAFFVATVCCFTLTAGTRAADSTRIFPHPDRIRFDGNCMTIDGKDILIFSGSFHYFRCPKELWADRFAKIKAAGFNTVETYIAWNLQEPQMPAGLDDYSQINVQDVEDWLNLAEKNGLYVIIRPGPYICAEFQRGGLPGWLETKIPAQPKHPLWVRSDDPANIDWSKHWFHGIDPVLVKHLITHKKPGEPGIILYQVENEYDYTNYPTEEKTNYVKALAQQAMDDGIDVPMITCWTRLVRGNADPVLRNVFDSCNFYVGWNVNGTLRDITSLRGGQPDAPLMTTELQGGWFTGTGANDVPELRPDSYNWRQDLVPAQVNNLTLFAWQNGETITNYYMLFGGTNLGDTAARGISTSYDYSCPIRENGGVDEKYLRVMALGKIIHDHGASLARSSIVTAQTTTDQRDVTAVDRRADDGSRFIFVRTNQHNQPRSGNAEIQEQGDNAADIKLQYDLEAYGSKVLYLPPGVTDAAKGQWLPETMPAIQRPKDIPASVAITESRTMTDPGPSDWKPMTLGKSLSDIGVYDSRYVYYKLDGFQANEQDISSAGGVSLKATHDVADRVVGLINGQRASLMSEPTDPNLPTASKALRPGANQLTLLYENAGYPNGGQDMLRLAGITRVHLAASGLGTIKDWRMQPADGSIKPENQPAIAVDFDDSSWRKITIDKVDANQITTVSWAIFRASVDLTQKDLDGGKTDLAISRMDDKGWVFVNGKLAGTGETWSQSYDFDVAKLLHPGKNVVAIVIQNTDGPGGLGTVELTASDTGGAIPLRK